MRRGAIVSFAVALVAIAGGGTSVGAAESQPSGLIAVVEDGRMGIKVIPATGGRVRRLTTSGRSPVWSPDGRWVAFQDARNVPKKHACRTNDDISCPEEIYLVRPDGTGERRLTPPASNTHSPVWAPDASKLVVGKGSLLYLINVDGSGFRRLTNNSFESEGPASWSPDGTEIAFEADTNPSNQGAVEDIYVINPAGQQRKLTNSSARRIGPSRAPDWSPDGRLIAFGADKPYASGPTELYLMNPLGRQKRVLTRSSVNPFGTAWSPDSRLIAYEKGSELDPGLFTVEVKSGIARRLTPRSRLDGWYGPSWSPDSEQLVATFVSGSRPENSVWIMNRDGSGKRRLLLRASAYGWQPARR